MCKVLVDLGFRDAEGLCRIRSVWGRQTAPKKKNKVCIFLGLQIEDAGNSFWTIFNFQPPSKNLKIQKPSKIEFLPGLKIEDCPRPRRSFLRKPGSLGGG